MANRPICPYCNRASRQVKGDVIYPHRPDLHYKTFYHCAACKAWVGCHEKSGKPLGRLANAELRLAKVMAHEKFDQLWINTGHFPGRWPKERRHAAYAWLAGVLDIPLDQCHIGMFDTTQCKAAREWSEHRLAGRAG